MKRFDYTMTPAVPMVAVDRRAGLLPLAAMMVFVACRQGAPVTDLPTDRPPPSPEASPSPLWQLPELTATPTPRPRITPTPLHRTETPAPAVTVRTPEVIPQRGDLVAIKTTRDPDKPAYVLIRQGVGILPISAGAYQNSIPDNASHTLFAHERATYRYPNGERIEWTIAQRRTRIQSTIFGVSGKPKGAAGTHTHAEGNRTFSGFSIDSDARMGVAAEGRVIRFFEAYPNPHHAEPAEDEATKQVLQRATRILWIQFATGEFRLEGVAAVIFPPEPGQEPLVTVYRIIRLARNRASQFSPEEQKQMAGTVHDLNYVMMALTKRDPQRRWIPITTLPLSQAQQLINVYVVSR